MIEICSMQKAGLCKVLSICGTKATLLSKEKSKGHVTRRTQPALYLHLSPQTCWAVNEAAPIRTIRRGICCPRKDAPGIQRPQE